MGNVVAMKVNLTARDVSGQRRYSVREVRGDATVQELVQGLVTKMGLPAQDSSGTAQVFHAFLERDGRHLRGSEVVGEVLREGDELVLHPDVQAGA
jgi:hypothetical protein